MLRTVLTRPAFYITAKRLLAWSARLDEICTYAYQLVVQFWYFRKFSGDVILTRAPATVSHKDNPVYVFRPSYNLPTVKSDPLRVGS